jgi:drug/metabolite transporter, DME family
VAVYTPLFFVAVDRTGVAVGTVVAIASGPFFAAGLDWRFRRIRPTATWLRGTVVTVVGVGVLIAAVDSGGTCDRPRRRRGGTRRRSRLRHLLGDVEGDDGTRARHRRLRSRSRSRSVPSSSSHCRSPESASWLATRAGLVMALYLGVVATGLAYVLFGFGLRRLTSATAVTLVLAEPLTAALLAAVVLDESIPAIGWVGVVVVLVGLVLVGRSASGVARGVT